MGPVAHAALAYLLWTGAVRLLRGRPPTDAESWVLLVASQFPDLVDKPLAWSLDVLPAGRSLGHSLVTATLIVVVLAYFLPEDRRSLVAAFGVGVVGHDLLDALAPLSRAEPEYLAYLLWPFLPQPPYETSRALLPTFIASVSGEVSGVELVVFAVVIAIWVADGVPGLPIRPWRRIRRQ